MSDKKGFFWVETSIGEITIAEYDDEAWSFIGSEASFMDLPKDVKMLGRVAKLANEANKPDAAALPIESVSGCYWCDNPLIAGQVMEVLPDNRGVAHEKCAEEFYGSKLAEY